MSSRLEDPFQRPIQVRSNLAAKVPESNCFASAVSCVFFVLENIASCMNKQIEK
jgi:hypothetical protein